MKYIIDVPSDNPMFVTACYLNDGIPKAFNLELEPYTEPDRQAVEDEVWDTAIKISIADNGRSWQEMTYQEAKAKYEEWKKQKANVRVGDEVYSKTSKWRGIVTDIDDGDLTILDGSGQTACHYNPKHFGKTGKHFDSIKILLEGLKEEM